MNNLQKIQNLAASVRDSLATLKPSSGLDDLDAIAKERSFIARKARPAHRRRKYRA